jgi:hypothetical protein
LVGDDHHEDAQGLTISDEVESKWVAQPKNSTMAADEAGVVEGMRAERTSAHGSARSRSAHDRRTTVSESTLDESTENLQDILRASKHNQTTCDLQKEKRGSELSLFYTAFVRFFFFFSFFFSNLVYLICLFRRQRHVTTSYLNT